MLLLTAAPGVQEWSQLLCDLNDHISADQINEWLDEDCYLETYKWVREAPGEEAERVTHWTTNPDGRADRQGLQEKMNDAIGPYGADIVGDAIGSGNFSVVFECPWDDTKAIKIGHGGLGDVGNIYADGWLEYALYCMKRHREGNANPLLPIIHKIQVGDGYFVALLEKYAKTASSFDNDQMRKFKTVRSIISSYDKPKEIDEEYAAYARELKADPLFPNCHDIHNGNVMCDEDGHIVITDPSSDTNAPHMEIERTLRIMGILPEDAYAEEQYQRRMRQKRMREKEENNRSRMYLKNIKLPVLVVDNEGVTRFDDIPQYANVALEAMAKLIQEVRVKLDDNVIPFDKRFEQFGAFGHFLAIDPAKPIGIRKVVNG